MKYKGRLFLRGKRREAPIVKIEVTDTSKTLNFLERYTVSLFMFTGYETWSKNNLKLC